MANRVYETMTRVVTNLGVVRIWRAVPDIDAPVETELLELGETVWGDRKKLAAVIEEVEGVSAYEILDEGHCGIVVYPDWS